MPIPFADKFNFLFNGGRGVFGEQIFKDLTLTELDATDADGNTEKQLSVAHPLPAYPVTGDRDNKVPKFAGDTLGWEVDDVAPPIEKATNADVDAETDDTKYLTVLKGVRLIARHVKNASTTVRGIVLLGRNEDVDSTETDPSRIPTITLVKRLLDRIRPTNRQLPDLTTGNDGQVPKLSVSGNQRNVSWQDDLSGTGGEGGLNQAQVEALIRAGVLDWAEAGNTSDIPDNKISANIARAASTNRFILYTLGNLYLAQAAPSPPPAKPLPSQITATTAGVTATTAPDWELTRPEATEALPYVFDVHVYGVEIDGVFGVLVGTPNRTDRYIDTYTDGEADLRVQAAKGTATPQNTPATPSAGTSNSWAPEDHDHGISPGTGGGSDGVANSVDLSLSGQDLTLTVGRSNSLGDLTDTVTLPSGGGSQRAFGSGAGEIATWAEGNSSEKIPLDDLGDERRASIPVRVIFQNPGSSNPTATDFATLSGQSGEFVDFPDATGQRIIDLWVGTQTLSDIQDITINNSSIFGTSKIFGTRREGTFLTVAGVAGMFWRSIVVDYNDYQHLRLYVRLARQTLPDLIVDTIHNQVDHEALTGSLQRWPTSKIPPETVIGFSVDNDSINVQGAAGSPQALTWPSTVRNPSPSDATPQQSGTSGSAGTSDDYSRADHRHQGDGGGGGGGGYSGLFQGQAHNIVNGAIQATDADGFDGEWFRYQGGSAGTVTFSNPTNTSVEYRITVHNAVSHLLTLNLTGVTNPVLAKDDIVVLLWDTLNTRWTVIPLSGELGIGSGSPETRIGLVDSVGVNSQTFREVALDEDFANGNDYQVIVTDDSTGNTASTPRFSGERARAKPLSAGVPTTIGNSVLSILTWREDITTPATASVSRWAIVPGRTRREVYLVGQNSGDLGTLTIEVFKYPRAEKGDTGDTGPPGADGSGAGDAQVNALHAISISEHNTSSLAGAAANPGNAFDGDTATSVSLAAGTSVVRGQLPRSIYGGRVILDITPATSVSISLEFWLNDMSQSDVLTGAITTAGMHGFQAPKTAWNRVIVRGIAFSGGAATLREVRVLDSGSTLPGVTEAELDVERTARLAADTALSTRIDGLAVNPTSEVGGDLLNVIAERIAVHSTLTLGQVAPSNLELGFSRVTPVVGSFDPAIPTGDLTNLVKVFMSRENTTDNRPPGGTINIQFRLFLEVTEATATRAWEGKKVVWGPTGDNPTLEEHTWTWGWHSQGRNTYYTDLVAHRPTAGGQTVTFNLEDVVAENYETFPGTPWIWHATIATTQEHISNADIPATNPSTVLAPTQRAVKAYTDTQVGTKPSLGSSEPPAVGTGTAGDATTAARSNHTHDQQDVQNAVRALGAASDNSLASERGIRLAIDAAVENIGTSTPITLINGVSGAFHAARGIEFTLSQALENGWLLEFSEGTSPEAAAYILSDTILSNTEMFATGSSLGPPQNRAGTVQVPIARHHNTGDVNTVVYFHRSTDSSKLWIGHGLEATYTVTLRAFPIGGGSSGAIGGQTGQNTYGSELIYLKSATATPTNTTKPTGIGYTGTGYSGLGSWTTVAPEPEAGFNILIIQLTRTFSGGSWHVGVGNIGQWYEGVNQQMPVRYINFGGEFTFTRSADNQYVEIWLSADNRYSEPIQIAGRASADLLLLARQDLPVSGTSTAGPTIATTRTLLRNYPKIGVNVQLRLGTIILRQKYFEIATEEIVPLSVANQNQTRAQRMLALAVNSPFAAGPNWIDLAIIDGNTTVQRHPSGYTRRYLMNFIRANNDPDGDSARVFSFINVAEHDAGTFASGVRVEFYGVQ